jgi:NADPH:quinone reductase-like Zn-dependent oxidoreductase
MRAIVLDHFGGLDSLVIKEIPEPEPEPGKVVIQVKAFGINHAEMHMRRGVCSYAGPSMHLSQRSKKANNSHGRDCLFSRGKINFYY